MKKEETEREKEKRLSAVIALILAASKKWRGDFLTREDLKTLSGDAFSVGHIANLDSKGKGPPGSFYFGRKRIYPKNAAVEWLIARVEV